MRLAYNLNRAFPDIAFRNTFAVLILIYTGKLSANQRLPSVRCFAKELHVSCSSAQSIYIHLKEKGVIYSVPSKNDPQNRTREKGQYGYNILVKLHRKEQKKAKSRRKGQKETRAQDGLDSSKTGGAGGNRTPVRRQLGKNFSGCSLLFTFPHPGGSKHPTGISSFMMHGMGKAYHTHGLHSNHTLARLVDLPGRTGA